MSRSASPVLSRRKVHRLVGEHRPRDEQRRALERSPNIESRRRSHPMYEQQRHRLLAWGAFLRRAARHMLGASLIMLSGVTIGTLGYRGIVGLGWVDAFLNAAMIS